ncbi:MAG: hypothetical protein LBG80_16875, partial [Bacteroidales bacterium]|nr:hypothetical protein [Bacteroidales bacterium]
MKKVSILLVIGIISCWIFTISAQTRMVITEKFDGNVTWTTSPATAWKKETNYYLSSPNSMRGIVPNKIGDEIELVSPVYDFRNYTDVQLRFSHICKVSPSDIVRVEYRRSMGGGMGAWEELSYETYLGKANIDQYRLHGFNADSYSEWKGNDSLALPNTSWWKEEIFDLWYEVGRTEAQFRFVLKHGATPATQISYGWLIDNIEITAANYQLLPPKVEWMGKNPKDTVYSVGPYTIDAKVKTATNSRILIPWLRYTSTYNGISTTDSVLMDHIRGDSVWSGVLPQFQDGTSVMYSITGKDSLDNYTTIMTGYIIQKPPQVERSGDVIIGTGTTESYYIPFGIYWNNSWNRQLYLASEIDSLSMGGFISKIAWDYISEPTVRDNQTCYLQAVDDVNISSNTYIDPIVAGATQVWTGSINLSEGWSEITLEQPFLLPPGKNLLVYWEHRHGKYNAYYFNTHSTGSTNMAVYCVSDASFPSGSTGTLITNRSNVKLYRMQTNFPDYSAGLIAINSPLRGQTTGNVSTPVTVTLQNKGDSLLTSATINWSVNGGQVNTYSWTGSLLWDFQEQVTIGNFIPRIEKYDTVLVWVSMPNGVLDSTSFDDTLSVIIYGCTPNMSGTYIVGPTGDFNNIQDAISVLSLCAPLGGDITFELEPGIYDKGVSLNDMGQVLGGNKLTITSTTHNANDVIIKPTSGTGIMFSKSNNIIIKDITVDARFATYAIQLTGVCRNILIRDCRLLADSTVTGNTSNPIYSTGGGLDSVFIIHNFISGGYYGIYFYGSSAATMNTNIIIDSNTVQDQYYYAMYVYYTHADRIIGNKIRQRSTSITYPYGIYFYGQQYTTPPNIALIANNELILSMSSSYYGMYLGYGQAEVINNSIFIKGSGAAKGIYITDVATNNFIIKNNNIVLTSDDNNAHPIYLSSTANLALYDFDYNNMWAPKCVGYAGGTIITLSDWQQTITTDQHSISVYPDYIDSSLYLQLRDYNGYECPKLSSVTLDAEGRIRTGITTTMGAYHGIPPYTVNATLINIAGNKEGLILGETDTIKVTLVNTGATTLTQATLKWEWNGVTQPNVVWTGSLLSENRIDILLGTVTYTSGGYYHIKAWIDNLSPLIDDYKDDDTAAITGYICTIPLNGVYQLGANNADFTSLKEFTNQLKLCGVNGDVTLKIQTGSYMEGLNLTDLDKIFGGYSLTITSTTGINTDVRIKKITLSMINNIIIKDITVDESNGTNAIQFSGACTNVLIRDCRLLANPTTTTTTSNPIYVTSGIGLDSIFI